MKIQHYGKTTAIGLLAALFASGAAYSNDLGEDGAWQFQSPAAAQVKQTNLQLIEAHDSSALQSSALSGSGSLGGSGSGLLSASNAPTNNYTQVVNETTISCAGAGTVCTATGGGNTTTVAETSTGSTTSNTNNVSGNTVSSTNFSNNSASNNNNPVLTPSITNNGTETNGSQTSGNQSLGGGGF